MNKTQVKENNEAANKLPFVSLCTPTYNRRKFIPHLIEWFNSQYYPKEKLEWIIIDDGTDPIGDLVESIPQVKYFYYGEKMCLGKKRNVMNSKCSGEFLVYIDDDDYYPLTRVTHAIIGLLKYPEYLCAGCSKIPIYYKNPKNLLITVGPFKRNHATAATFAFRKELLGITHFQDSTEKAEEGFFLKKYSIPLLHLDPFNTIIVISHGENTFDKNFILKNPKKYRVEQYNTKILHTASCVSFYSFIKTLQ